MKDNEKYEPETDPIVKEPGEPTTEEEVIDKVTIPNYPEDKEDPKITVKNPDDLPDGNTPGEYDIPVIVEYPDGSEDETTVTVIVKDKPDNEKYEPETDPIVKEPGEPTTEEEVIDKVTIPDYPEDKEGPKITVKNPDDLPDGNTPGEYDIPVIVEYPDGSEDETTVTVIVKDKENVTLTFDPNGGTWSDNTTDNKYVETKLGSIVDILEAPTREGYKFLFWKGSEYQPGDKYEVVGNHTFVAQWEAEPAPEKSKTPTVDKITEGDDKITGEGEPGSDIVVELPDGTVIPGKVDENGNWTVEVPKDKELKKDDVIKVVQKEKGKTPSDAVTAKVIGKTTPIKPEAPSPSTKGEVAKTGDTSYIALATGLLSLAIAGALLVNRKRDEE